MRVGVGERSPESIRLCSERPFHLDNLFKGGWKIALVPSQLTVSFPGFHFPFLFPVLVFLIIFVSQLSFSLLFLFPALIFLTASTPSLGFLTNVDVVLEPPPPSNRNSLLHYSEVGFV